MLGILVRLMSCMFFLPSLDAAEECMYVDYLDKRFNITEVGCPSDNICNKQRVFNVRYIRLPPYFMKSMNSEHEDISKGKIKSPLEQLLDWCCGTCKNISKMGMLENMKGLTRTTMNGSDFIYPVLSTASKRKMYGYHYIPLIDLPGMVYATEQPNVDLRSLLLHVLPVCFVNSLLCMVAGFVCWLLETWKNPDEFPRNFFIGWYEGAWWAFVSMTTVGYGDKAPRSALGRIYSTFWITIGIIAYGLLTGIVYTEVEKVNTPPPPDMSGKNIGSLLFRDYDAIMIGDVGSRSVRNNPVYYADFERDFLRLVEKLEKKEIDGFVVDQFTFSYLFYWATSVTKHSEAIFPGLNETGIGWIKSRLTFLGKKVMLQKMSYKPAQPFAYGALVKKEEDYLYFKDTAENLRQNIGRKWNEIFQDLLMSKQSVLDSFYHPKNDLFSHTGDYFRNTLIAVAAMVAFIIIVGFVYEIKKKQKRAKTHSSTG